MTSRSARFSGTIVNGSNEALSARHPRITTVNYGCFPASTRDACVVFLASQRLNSRLTRAGDRLRHHGEPAVPVRDGATRDPEILALNPLRDGTRPPFTDRNPIDA